MSQPEYLRIADRLYEAGCNVELLHGVIPFIKPVTQRDAYRALKAIRDLGLGCDMFQEGFVIKPPADAAGEVQA